MAAFTAKIIVNNLLVNLYILGGFITLTGVVVGSFLNALVWRIRKRIPIGGKERSQCVHCHHQLAWYDLIPVVSWLILRAKCRYCHKPISAQYPIVEVTNGILWLISFWALHPERPAQFIGLIAWFLAVSVLLALAVYDIRWMELPDRLVAIFGVLAGLIALLNIDFTKFTLYQYLDPLLGVLFIAGLFYFLFQISDGKWIGGGDVKLAAGMGLLLGLQGSVIALFIASLMGSVFGLSAMAIFKRDRKQVIPFGPFLISATFVVFLFGERIFAWYISNLL